MGDGADYEPDTYEEEESERHENAGQVVETGSPRISAVVGEPQRADRHDHHQRREQSKNMCQRRSFHLSPSPFATEQPCPRRQSRNAAFRCLLL